VCNINYSNKEKSISATNILDTLLLRSFIFLVFTDTSETSGAEGVMILVYWGVEVEAE
jgi:hypothetical protein